MTPARDSAGRQPRDHDAAADFDLRRQFQQAVISARPGNDLVAIGGDLSVSTMLAAYAVGVFPMGVGEGTDEEDLGWWSPDPRGVLPLESLRVSHSLRRSMRHFELRVDTAFAEVVAACADTRRPGAWITPAFQRAYRELHRRGVAHSVEVWQGDRLVGGLFGLSIGGLFAGESMFHRVTDASKAALVGLVKIMQEPQGRPRAARLLDVQWRTDHLATLGVQEIPRAAYLAQLAEALAADGPHWAFPE